MSPSTLQSLMAKTRVEISEAHYTLEALFDLKKYYAEKGELQAEYDLHTATKKFKAKIEKLVIQQKELKACYYEELMIEKLDREAATDWFGRFY